MSRNVSHDSRSGTVVGGAAAGEDVPGKAGRAVIWADSGPGVGLGHVARCCAVGGELRARGTDVVLVTPDARGAEFTRALALPTIEASGGFEVALELMSGSSVAVLDSYRLTAEEYIAARAVPLLAVFSDSPQVVPACDVLINGVPGAERLGYARQAGREDLLGAAYFPLRPEFRDAPARAVSPRVERLVVTVGGEDVHGHIPSLVAVVRQQWGRAHIAVITGRRSAGLQLPDPACELLVAPSDYPALVRGADVIVCGAGQTLVEAAGVGTPAAALLLGADQQHQHAAMVAEGTCVDGGAWDLPGRRPAAVLRAALERLQDGARRAAMSERGRAVVDGRGASRIAQAILERAAARAAAPR